MLIFDLFQLENLLQVIFVKTSAKKFLLDSVNTTRELLSEIQLVKYNLKGVTDEFDTLRRQSSIRETASLQMEERLTEMANQ